MSQIKILFVTSKSIGGSGKHIYNLVKGLPKEKFECHLIYFRLNAQQDSELERVFDKVFVFKRKPSFSLLSNFVNVLQIARLTRTHNYDVVHSHTSLGGFIGRIGGWVSCKNLSIGHTIHAFGADQFVKNPQRMVYAFIEKTLDKITDFYVAPSKFVKEYGEQFGLITGSRARVIYNAIDISTLSIREGRDIERTRLGLSRSEIVFLFCGRIEEQKGLDILVRAIAGLPSSLNFKLVVCGDGGLHEDIVNLAKDLGCYSKIHWAGWVDDLSRYYCSADIFVLPTRWESFGLVFLEAMRYGLPIISTTTQAVPEVVEEGVTGLLVGKDDVRGLRDRMLLLATNEGLRARLGKNSNSIAIEKFSYAGFLKMHQELYREHSKRFLLSGYDC